ncbi:S-adenosyl-l-methionine hydroxide adenosyltransferase family protein [Azotosporobacter soli]|uniref:SAM hydrolase/SAM-dependent halogenase family protein n=1 Tax=Azotosporobacter soli TaxID=3055040 RepID=UPI0031FEA308
MMKLNRVAAIVLILLAVFSTGVLAQEAKGNALVLQTDFGLKDGAVSAMKGVAIGVDADLRIFDLTHEIPAYNIWEASYRLMQTASYWPAGTVFVSVVDPGVGTDRKSVVVKTKTGHYFVTPDNGTLTLIEESMGISEVREIDENINRLPGSSDSYTFHGRDVYAYTGARLAAKAITFEQIGPVVNREIVKIGYQKAVMQGDAVLGNIPILDIQYGNVWTNIDKKLIDALNIKKNDLLKVEIYNKGNRVYQGTIPYVNSFGDVPDGKPLAYANSLMQLSFALNMDSFSAVHKVYSGPEWTVKVQKVSK